MDSSKQQIYGSKWFKSYNILLFFFFVCIVASSVCVSSLLLFLWTAPQQWWCVLLHSSLRQWKKRQIHWRKSGPRKKWGLFRITKKRGIKQFLIAFTVALSWFFPSNIRWSLAAQDLYHWHAISHQAYQQLWHMKPVRGNCCLTPLILRDVLTKRDSSNVNCSDNDGRIHPLMNNVVVLTVEPGQKNPPKTEPSSCVARKRALKIDG